MYKTNESVKEKDACSLYINYYYLQILSFNENLQISNLDPVNQMTLRGDLTQIQPAWQLLLKIISRVDYRIGSDSIILDDKWVKLFLDYSRNLGEVYIKTGDYGLAVDLFEKTIKTHTDIKEDERIGILLSRLAQSPL